jgi:hypothetical protein
MNVTPMEMMHVKLQKLYETRRQTNRGAQNMKHGVTALIVKVAEVILQKQADW